MKHIFWISLFAIMITQTACVKKVLRHQHGSVMIEDRNLGYFDKVQVDGAMDVEFVEDSTYNISITAPSGILPYIETYVQNGKLYIRERHHHYRYNDRIKVLLSVSMLRSLTINGSSDAFSNYLTSDVGGVTINGSGDVNMYYEVSHWMDADIVGSGDIELYGSAYEVDVEIEGSGDFKGRTYYTNNAYVRIEGSGDVEVFATDTLDVIIEGSGNVYYWGNPNYVITSIDGSGQVIRK